MRACSPNLVTAAVVFISGCVSVHDYSQVRDQLRVEQRRAIERERRVRELELLAGKLRKRTTVAELELAEVRSRLAAAEKLLVLKPPGGAGPPATRPETAGERGVLAAEIVFRAGGDHLTAEHRAKIAEIAEILASRKGVRTFVEGHSDPSPIDRTQSRYRSNMHLSTLRALAVYEELLSHEGVDPSRVAVVGYGEHRPVPGGLEALRRVEIRLLPE